MKGCSFKNCRSMATRVVTTTASLTGLGGVEIELPVCDVHADRLFNRVIGPPREDQIAAIERDDEPAGP